MKRTCNIFAILGLLIIGHTSPAKAADEVPTSDQKLAHRLEQIARLLPGAGAEAADAALDRARLLLDRANALNPHDAERWLLVAEAAEMAEDHDVLLEALRHYVRLRPSDDVAQLRMIDLLAQSKQNVEERLAFFLRLVEGPASRQFTAALRSRVAYRAAVLAAEQGERAEYRRLLGLALQLDGTNKHAAGESVRVLLADDQATLADRAAGMFTLFQADPTDAATHASIADLHLAHGSYAGAVDWYVSAERAQAARGGNIDIPLVHNWAMALWGSGQSAAALQLLSYLDPPKPADGADGAAEEAAAPAGAPIETLMLRSVIAASGAGELKADEHFAALVARFESIATDEQADGDLLAGRIWAHLLCERQLGSVKEMIDQLGQRLGDAATVTAMRGWLAMRTGDPDEATRLLEPLVGDDARAALGLAYVIQARGDTEGYIAQLKEVYRRVPDDIFGLTAAGGLRRESVSLPVTSEVRQMANLFNQIPEALRNIALQPLRFVQVKVTADSLRYDYGQPQYMTVELRNVSNYPLALGADATIPTRLLLLPTVRLNNMPGPQLQPIIVDVYRTLRLGPQRSMSVTMRLDVASIAQVLDVFPNTTVSLDMVAILNPRVARNGRFEPGLLGSSVQVRNVVRRGTPVNADGIDRLISQLSGSDPALVMDAAALLIPMAQQLPAETPEVQAVVDRIVGAVDRAFDRLTPGQQAWAVATVRQDENVQRQPFADMLSRAARLDDDLVQMVLLATQVREVDSPILNAALRRPDRNDPVRRFAQATRTVLEKLAEAAEEPQAP